MTGPWYGYQWNPHWILNAEGLDGEKCKRSLPIHPMISITPAKKAVVSMKCVL